LIFCFHYNHDHEYLVQIAYNVGALQTNHSVTD